MNYLYHECSECLYQVRIQQSVLTTLYFGETFKFCPNCGNAVVRFANLPKFKEEFNRAVFSELEKIDRERQDKLDYYCRITLNKDEFEQLRKQCNFAVELQKNGDLSILSPSIKDVAKMCTRSWNHWEIKKLKERVGENNA